MSNPDERAPAAEAGDEMVEFVRSQLYTLAAPEPASS